MAADKIKKEEGETGESWFESSPEQKHETLYEK
jgi:hypothetical protein